MGKEIAVKAKNLSKRFRNGIVAVNKINFEIEEGEIIGLLGPNGSGKTTTQRMLATVLQPSRGSIFYYGKKMHTSAAADNEIRHLIGYVPQKDSLYDDLSVMDNILFFSEPYNISRKETKKRTSELIEELGLGDYKKCLVRDLSGGYRMRASIAASLVHNPKIIYFDEVTMGLDPNSRYKIWELTKELNKKATIIMTTHYMDEAMELCDRIAILSKGKILATDKPKSILKKYKSKNLNQVIAKVIDQEK